MYAPCTINTVLSALYEEIYNKLVCRQINLLLLTNIKTLEYSINMQQTNKYNHGKENG